MYRREWTLTQFFLTFTMRWSDPLLLICSSPQQAESDFSSFIFRLTCPSCSDRYDEGPNNRQMLLWAVRLIIVDPYLMLHNPNKLDHETQMSTFELINGLVSLVHDTAMMPDVAHAAMESLLVLHETRNIDQHVLVHLQPSSLLHLSEISSASNLRIHLGSSLVTRNSRPPQRLSSSSQR